MSNNTFKGYYFKHQKDGITVAFIPGRSKENAFIQVMTNEWSENFVFPTIRFGAKILVGDCEFSNSGIKVNLPNISGEIRYIDITPIKYDIMGPFRYLPMECRHGIISMYHHLDGTLVINGKVINFTGGVGYIEKDSGRSFPQKYIWLQCNDFRQKCSITASVAHIPFKLFSFMGCICVIIYGGKEYRFTTYLGVKIVDLTENRLVLTQGKYNLEIDIQNQNSHKLYAPKNGQMTDIVHESNTSKARFKLFVVDKEIFDLESENVSFEYHM